MSEKEFNLFAKRVLIAVACLLYLISPVDLLPDVFFPAGFADDLAVLAIGARKMLTVKKA